MAALDQTVTITCLTENTLLIRFAPPEQTQPSPELAVCIGACRELLLHSYPALILDCVPAYTSLLIYYDLVSLVKNTTAHDKLDPLHAFAAEVLTRVRQHLTTQQAQAPWESKLIEIPVYYGEEVGPDLATLAERKNVSHEQIIGLHTASLYSVFAMGFKPGFAYLGFVDEKICAPRLATSRQKVPAGSVGIADRQTGIYPCDSPGGWNIIGQTPSPIFFPGAKPEDSKSVFSVGARVKFLSISRQEFLERRHD